MKKSYVYKITCKINGEFYFGSSFNAKSDKYWGGGRKIRERISQYGKENFIKEILGEFDDRTESHRVENEYIEKFRNDDKCLNQQLDRKFGTYGEDSCAKMSAAQRGDKNPMYGKIFSDEHIAKLSAAHRGENLSDETRARMSAARRGKHHTEETRAKMSAARRGNTNVLGKHWRKNKITGKREYYD